MSMINTIINKIMIYLI